MNTIYKIHPAIGVARVGDSQDYYLGPVEVGGLPLEKDGTTPVTSFRDGSHAMRRQAAHFAVYVYDDTTPNGRLVEIGKDGISDIEWTVHVANKKSAWRQFLQLEGENGYTGDHPYRNPLTTGPDRKQLIIDPGPQTLRCKQSPNRADFSRGNGVTGYKQTFPPQGLIPEGSDIDTLGSMMTSSDGSVVVLGGFGKSGVCTNYSLSPDLLKNLKDEQKISQDVVDTLINEPPATNITNNAYDTSAAVLADLQKHLSTAQFQTYGSIIADHAIQPRLDTYANNNYWWDDISDGQVTAQLIISGGPPVPVQVPAWVLVAPPAYAPQIVNMVTLYDTMNDLFVRNFNNYRPDIYDKGFRSGYQVNLETEILPILSRPAAYRWVSNINAEGLKGHAGATDPASPFMSFLRKPGDYKSPGQMPQLAGDNPINSDNDPRKYLTLTETQYFLLQQCDQGNINGVTQDTSGPGEKLDRAVLENCVGGPFCPGIEMTWISRDVRIYSGPFRINHKKIDLAVGLSLSEILSDGMEPGDISRYMALPWQADFNECSDQDIDNKLLWWWPAQRPYVVYPQDQPDQQVYWTRPDGSDFKQDGADYDEDVTMVYNWKTLGFVIQKDSSFQEVERLTPVNPDAGKSG